MGKFTGTNTKLRLDGEVLTVAVAAQRLNLTPWAVLHRYRHRKARGMELSLRALAKPLTGTTQKLIKPRPITPFVAQLRKHMLVQGRHIRDLAAHLGIHRDSVSRLLCERRAITPERLAQLCDWLMLTDEEEHELNVLAARQHGWKV